MSTQDAGVSPPRWRGVHKALADPLRIRLLEALWEMPRSARELADHVDLPADRLYYHLNQLERAGLIEIA
ncbi:winged helix-turn-helix domain-containing protein [Streptomyces prunicolor]|uniref:ArsR/SmtB family transcription factor n=1 Tax=Streptomyces prunicolor TaxID=67348 RepID=UPI00386674D7|nr:winged helix-turn-helix domain-containing protein [Streptomyces prunicolor]